MNIKDLNMRLRGGWQNLDICYPLAEEGINESEVLAWAKNQPIFQDWYKYFRRQGCMFCPMIKKKELAYMYKKYPKKYAEFRKLVIDWEKKFKQKQPKGHWWVFDKPFEEIEKTITVKWLSILEEEENQMNMFEMF